MNKTKIAHIAIATQDIEKAKGFFELLANTPASENKVVEDQKVNTSFINIGETHFELLEPTSDDSPISKFLDKRGGGIHHICIETDQFQELIENIKSYGVRTLGEPSIGAKGKKIVFFHPKDTYNVLIELEEA